MHPSAPGGSAAASPTANPAWRAAVDAAIARLCDLPGPLLPILHEIQAQLGYVSPHSVPLLAVCGTKEFCDGLMMFAAPGGGATRALEQLYDARGALLRGQRGRDLRSVKNCWGDGR